MSDKREYVVAFPDKGKAEKSEMYGFLEILFSMDDREKVEKPCEIPFGLFVANIDEKIQKIILKRKSEV